MDNNNNLEMSFEEILENQELSYSDNLESLYDVVFKSGDNHLIGITTKRGKKTKKQMY
jgi:hypothetical protein